MKATVIRRFFDAQDPGHPIYAVGSPFEGSAARVRQLEEKGFVKTAEKKATKKTTKRKA